MSLKCHAVGSRAARGRNWSPRSRNLCSAVGQKRAYFSANGHIRTGSRIREWGWMVLLRSSNWERYLLARRFDRAPRARVARHPPPRLQALRTSFSAVRARTSLCSAPKVRRQDPAGESNPPRLSPGGVGAAAATAGEHGRLPRGARRRKKRHERRTLKRCDTARQGPSWGGACFTCPPPQLV